MIRAIVLVAVAIVAVTACAPDRDAYHAESLAILDELPLYPGLRFEGVVTEENSCETWCWFSHRGLYTIAYVDASAADPAASPDDVLAFYRRELDDWDFKLVYPTPGDPDPQPAIIAFFRKGGAKVTLNAASRVYGPEGPPPGETAPPLDNVSIVVEH